MDASVIYYQTRQLLEVMPELTHHTVHVPDVQTWLSRAYAVVELSGNVADIADMRIASEQLASVALADRSRLKIQQCMRRILARAELQMPVGQQGAFLAIGEDFTSVAAVSKVVAKARTEVLFIDPYASEVVLTDFAVLAGEGVGIKVLADSRSMRPGLRPVAQRWGDQYGSERSLEVRVSRPGQLHDRFIFVDRTDVWSITQSFKDLAARAPAGLFQVQGDTVEMKLHAYSRLWDAATPLT